MTAGPVAVAIDEDNPWPGLGSFDETAERFFNGRHLEAAELRRLVRQSPLTVLFGASGLGKTSLLQAGLFPGLRKEHYLPIYIRLDVRDRSAPLIQQVKLALQAQITGRQVDAPVARDDESLWAYLHRPQLELWSAQNQLLSPVFVFDQFEEVFTLGAENPVAIARFRIELADLIENRIPNELARRTGSNEAGGHELALDSQPYKVILSFREDFLPAVEGWKRDLPSILRNRLRLLPMSGEHAFEAVHTTAGHLVDEPLARAIVRFVAAAQDHGLTKGEEAQGLADLAVEPALLSLVCHGLNEKRKAQHKSTFDAALLSGTGHAVISDFYDNAVREFSERVQRFIENELITERGFRKPCDVDDARSIHGVTAEELRRLVDRRLLRIEPQRGSERVELTHDLLTRVVREHRDIQRERIRSRLQRRRMAIFAAAGMVLSSLVVLFGWLYIHARTQEGYAREQAAEAQRASGVAEAERRKAEGLREKAQTALQEVVKIAGDLKVQQGIAEDAAHQANVSREEAVAQASVAAGRRQATEALYRFDSSGEGLAVSGALAALSMATAPSSEGWKALAQVLRLIPAAPEILPKAHSRPVRALSFSRDGRIMASAGEDGTAALWDLSTGIQKRGLEGRFQSAPSGFGLALAGDGQWLAAGAMGSLWIWNTANPSQAQSTIDHDNLVRSVTFSPDGQLMATASRGTGLVRLFQLTSGRWNEAPGLMATAPTYKANSVSFLTNDMLVLAGSHGNPHQHGVWFWDLGQKKEAFLLASDVNENFGECRALTVAQQSTRLAALCSRGIFVADRQADGFVASRASRDDSGSFSISYGLALSADGRYLAAIDNGGVVHVFGNAGEQEVSRMTLPATSVAFRPGGRVLAAGLRDGSIALWPTTKGTAAIRLADASASSIVFSADERWLATAGQDETIRVLDISNVEVSRPVQSLRLGSGLGRPVFSPDGRFLVVPGKTSIHVLRTRPWKALPQHDLAGEVTQATFSADSRLLVTLGPAGVRCYQTATWKPTNLSTADTFSRVAFSPDGRLVVATGTRALEARRGSRSVTTVWDAITGVEVGRSSRLLVPGSGSSEPEQQGDRRVVAASETWGRADQSLSPDRTLKTALDGSAVELEEAGSKRTIARLEHDGEVVDAVFSPRGRWLATAARDGSLRLWPLLPKEILQQACKMLPRNLTPDEWKGLEVGGPYRKTCPALP